MLDAKTTIVTCITDNPWITCSYYRSIATVEVIQYACGGEGYLLLSEHMESQRIDSGQSGGSSDLQLEWARHNARGNGHIDLTISPGC